MGATLPGLPYERIAALDLTVEDLVLEPLAMTTQAGWARHTTVVRLRGWGCEGVGEDVTYEEVDQKEFQAARTGFPIVGEYDRCPTPG